MFRSTGRAICRAPAVPGAEPAERVEPAMAPVAPCSPLTAEHLAACRAAAGRMCQSEQEVAAGAVTAGWGQAVVVKVVRAVGRAGAQALEGSPGQEESASAVAVRAGPPVLVADRAAADREAADGEPEAPGPEALAGPA